MEKILWKAPTSNAIVDVDTTKRIVVGYFAKFDDEIDSDGDVIAPGAFTNTLKMNGPSAGNRIWHLWNHSFSEPINKPYLITEDKSGERFETKFPDTTVGRDKLILYQEKAITEHSFGYNVIDSERMTDPSTGKSFNYLKELRQWEGSSVLWGSNMNSQTVGMKGEDFMLKSTILENLLRNGSLSDETFEMIEKLLKDIQAIFKGAGNTEPKEEPEPIAPSNPDAIKLKLYKQLNSLI